MIDATEIPEEEEASKLPVLRAVNQEDLALMPVMDIGIAKRRYKELVAFVKDLMVEDRDFGTIPGTAKPTLYKPGAEKLTTFFGLSKEFEIVNEIEDWDRPLFYYRYRSRLSRGNLMIAEGDGSANSMEDRYRWRWLPEAKLPNDFDLNGIETREVKLVEFEFAYDKRETSGQYGKPESYWQKFDEAIEEQTIKRYDKKARSGKVFSALEIGGWEYRIENPDLYTLVNTLQKMAQKRAFIAATLLAVNASEFFTQDLEDLAPAGAIVEAEASDNEVERAKQFVEEHSEGRKNYVTEFWALTKRLGWDKHTVADFLVGIGLKDADSMSKEDFQKAYEALKEQHGGPED